ncbi:DUF2470 domain-containing protein [Streptomyces sp. JJ66]|uniref:DUF2470 domain-containing protein n=1 Tax=Streptomyces sp. JJ66 TaxID=2803843 RepID=UPI001C57929F|nr:DUF2470 domain-containing protein [Streptomyces sp. JJ66]MBW1604153.1 DUF2470 domain-containing protein [Streptomyces sp. JJ66]
MFRPGSPVSGTRDDAKTTDQPRPVEDGAERPCAAERVRTLVDSSVSAQLSIPGAESTPAATTPLARAVTPEGDVIVLVSADSPAARAAAYAQDDDVIAVMEITDVAPVSVPHRIRGRAQVAGWLTAARGDAAQEAAAALLHGRQPHGPLPFGPDRMMLRLEVGEAVVDDLWGEGQVEPEEFAAARPDPLAAHEADLLQHLAAAHEEQVLGLCSLLGERAEVCGAGLRAVPLALDRFGLRVRYCPPGPASAPAGAFDAHFPFPEPVTDVARLRRAMHTLFDAAEAA